MELRVLGNTNEVRLRGGRSAQLHPRSLALLAYLAIAGPCHRDHLAMLFWPDSVNGLNALSTTLNRIRTRTPESISLTGPTIVTCHLRSDVDTLRAACADGDSDTILTVYDAPFLNGLRLRRCGFELEEWILTTRTAIASLVETALLRVARNASHAGNPTKAAELAAAAYDLIGRDGLVTVDYLPAYFELLAGGDHQYAVRVQQEAEEFGVHLPDGALLTGQRAMPSELLEAPAAPPGPPRIPTRPLRGFRWYVAQLAQLVATSPLTTVTGIGGSGKTRLVLDYLERSAQASSFEKIVWVDLALVIDPELVRPSIASAFGAPLRPGESLVARLPADTPLLLILDNFEHLLDAALVIDEVLANRPRTHVLVTSRVPLNLAAETVLPLRGLEIGNGPRLSPAEELFVDAAVQAGADLAIEDDDIRLDVQKVCRLVQGLPLALELTGAWSLVLSPAEIADNLWSTPELLNALPSGPTDQTVGRVIDSTWEALDDEQVLALLALSVFADGCSSAAAMDIGELPLTVLGQLVRRCVVIADSRGRFGLHPLIAQTARSKLSGCPDLGERLKNVHGHWYSLFLAGRTDEIRGPRQSDVLTEIDTEYLNIAVAWTSACTSQNWARVETMLDPLRMYLEKVGRIAEAEKLLGAAVTAFDASSSTDNSPLLARLLEALAWFHILAGRLDRVDQLLADARKLEPSPWIAAKLLRTDGVLCRLRGMADDAMRHCLDGIEILEQASDPWLSALLTEDLGFCHTLLGNDAEATVCFRKTLATGRTLGDPHMVARSYLTLSLVEIVHNPSRAVALLKEGQALAEQTQLRHLLLFFPGDLGRAELELNNASSACEYFTDGIEAADRFGHVVSSATYRAGRAEALRRLGSLDRARDDVVAAVRLARDTTSWPSALWAGLVAARLSLEDGEACGLTQDLVNLVASHPASAVMVRREAQELCEQLGFDQKEPNAEFIGLQSKMDEVVEAVLEVAGNVEMLS